MLYFLSGSHTVKLYLLGSSLSCFLSSSLNPVICISLHARAHTIGPHGCQGDSNVSPDCEYWWVTREEGYWYKNTRFVAIPHGGCGYSDKWLQMIDNPPRRNRTNGGAHLTSWQRATVGPLQPYFFFCFEALFVQKSGFANLVVADDAPFYCAVCSKTNKCITII